MTHGSSRRSGGLLLSSIRSSILLILTCLPAPALADTLQGRVVDPAGRPVAHASVVLTRGQTVVAVVPTDTDGRFGPLTVAAGDYEVVVSAPGLRLAPTIVRAGTDATLNLDLKLDLAGVGESVVVSSSQTDTMASRATGSVTVIDRATLDDLQVDSVADALHQTPGFSVVTTGGRGAVTSLFPRGGESDYTLVLVDGIEQNAFGGGFDAAHLATAAVDRIEVVRGPQSALYGAGAIGGIVQVITANGGDFRGTGQFEAGSFGTGAASGSLAGSKGPWTLGGGADWLRTDGVTGVVNGYTVTNDDYSRTSASASLGWSDTPSRRVRLDVRGGRNERGYPGPYGSDPLGSYPGIDTISRGITKHAAVGLTAKLGQNATVVHSTHVNWLRSTSAYASTFGDSEVEANRTTARYQFDWNRTHSPVSAGVEWSGEQEDNTYITGDAFQPIPVQRSMGGFFAEVRPSLSDRLFASIGVRSDRIERKPLTTDGFGRPPFDEQVVWSTNPKMAFAWLLSQGGDESIWGWTKLRFGAGTGIKAPTAFEIAFTNNPDLKPERSRSVDVGLEQALASSRVIADATWFYNSYDDLIISVGSALAGASRFRTDNIANARAQGLELGVSWHPTLALAVRGAWTWLDTDVLDVDSLPGEAPPPYNVGDSLIRRPSSSGSFDVRWSGGLMSAFLAVSGRGSMLDIEPSLGRSTVTNRGFVTTSMGAAMRVHRAVEVYARLNNSFDRYYEDAFGYPALGRSASFGVRVTSSR